MKVVRALQVRVQTRDDEGRPGTVENLVVIRTVTGEPRTWYSLARGPEGTTLEKFVQVHARRHGIEELLQRTGRRRFGPKDLTRIECVIRAIKPEWIRVRPGAGGPSSNLGRAARAI